MKNTGRKQLLLALIGIMLLMTGLSWTVSSGFSSASSPCGTLDECFDAARNGDSGAADYIRQTAERGDPDAQLNLGILHFYGYVVEQDYTEAVKWFRKAAEQGNANAQKNLGYMYLEGYGIEKNYEEALAWYRKAAEQGNEDAQNALKRLEK